MIVEESWLMSQRLTLISVSFFQISTTSAVFEVSQFCHSLLKLPVTCHSLTADSTRKLVNFTLTLVDRCHTNNISFTSLTHCVLMLGRKHPEVMYTIKLKVFGPVTGRSEQTVQTQITLLLKEQSDEGLHCLPVHLHSLTASCILKSNFSIFRTVTVIVLGDPIFRIFMVIATVTLLKFPFYSEMFHLNKA